MKLENAVLMLLNIKANEYCKYLRGAYSVCLLDRGMFFMEQVKGQMLLTEAPRKGSAA